MQPGFQDFLWGLGLRAFRISFRVLGFRAFRISFGTLVFLSLGLRVAASFFGL